MRTGPQDGGNSAAAAEFGVDTNQVKSAADYVRQVGSVMAREVDRLMANLEGMKWTGDAKNAFVAAKTQWEGASQNLHGALEEIATGLEGTAGAYDNWQQDVTMDIRKVASNLTYS